MAHGRIRVRGDNGRPLHLTTADEATHNRLVRSLTAEGFLVEDEFFGYSLYKGDAGVRDAMATVRMFCKPEVAA